MHEKKDLCKKEYDCEKFNVNNKIPYPNEPFWTLLM